MPPKLHAHEATELLHDAVQHCILPGSVVCRLLAALPHTLYFAHACQARGLSQLHAPVWEGPSRSATGVHTTQVEVFQPNSQAQQTSTEPRFRAAKKKLWGSHRWTETL